MKHLLTFIFILFFKQTIVFSQDNRFISFGVADGLSQNSVQCIFQDRDGLLWIGTQDGLNSFDGKNFKVYRYHPSDTNSLSDHFVLSIAEDADGFLWIGTGHGLNKLNKHTGKISRIYLNDKERNELTANYNIILTNSANELFIPHNKNSYFIKKQIGLTASNLNSANNGARLIDSDDNIWGINLEKQLILLNKKSNYTNIVKFSLPTILNSSKATIAMALDKKKVLWVYTKEAKSKICFFDLNSRKWLDNTINLPTVINHINIPNNGIAWVATNDGLYLVNNFKIKKQLINKKSNQSILPGNILFSYQDKQENIWIGSANAGLAYYNPKFDNFKLTATGIDNNAVTSGITIDEITWMGTTSGLVSVKNNIVLSTLFSGKRIPSITVDKQKNIWVAVQNDGLYILNSKGAILKKYYQTDSILNTTQILHLFSDTKGRVFVCTEVGYFVFTDANHWKSVYLRNNKKTKTGWYVLHAFEDNLKQIWLSKHLGIDVLNERLELIKEIRSDNTLTPIKRAIVTGVTQDKSNNIWIGSLRSGVYLLRGDSLIQFTTANGLTSDLIYGINCDNRGRIWATTPSGISVFEPTDKRFYPLTVADGLPTNEYTLSALLKTNNGTLLAGSTKGLVTIHADEIELKKVIANAIIKNVLVNNENISTKTRHLVLKSDLKTLSFEFTTNQSLQYKNVFFQYKLVGVDEVWNNLSGDKLQITYTTLPYKKLIMQVRAASSPLDLDTATIDEFSFEIKPPFWLTNWFLLFVFISLISLVSYLFHLYNKTKYRKQIQIIQTQKQLQTERNRISRDLHDNIGAYTSALIAGINQLKKGPENKSENIEELGDYASNIMGYLRETIWVLNNEKLTITAFSDRFKNYALRIVKNYPSLSITFNVSVKNDRVLTPQLSLNLFRILQESLQNCCKHSLASNIEIDIFSNEKILCKVSDDGIGIANKNLNENYGFKNMQQRALESDLDFRIESTPTNGTQIIISEK